MGNDDGKPTRSSVTTSRPPRDATTTIRPKCGTAATSRAIAMIARVAATRDVRHRRSGASGLRVHEQQGAGDRAIARRLKARAGDPNSGRPSASVDRVDDDLAWLVRVDEGVTDQTTDAFHRKADVERVQRLTSGF